MPKLLNIFKKLSIKLQECSLQSKLKRINQGKTKTKRKNTLQNKRKKELQVPLSKQLTNKTYSKELKQQNFKIKRKVHYTNSIVAEIQVLNVFLTIYLHTKTL